MKDDEIPGETIGKEKISQLPKSQLEILQDSLDNALKAEDYETAAKIRDQIRKLLENPS